MKPYFVFAGFVFAGMVLAVFSCAQAGSLFRWVDESGDVHYGDQPPATQGVQIEQKKFATVPDIENADLPYEARRAHQNFPVTLYVAHNCKEFCEQARDFLNKRGIPFTEKDLLMQDEVDEFRQQSGSDLTPTLGVGKTYLKGFQAEQWNNELDIAGYPKALFYRPPQAPVNPSADKGKLQ